MTASEDGRGRNVRARVASPEPDLRVNEDPGDPDASRALLDALSALRAHATWREVVQAATPYMPPNVHGSAFRMLVIRCGAHCSWTIRITGTAASRNGSARARSSA